MIITVYNTFNEMSNVLDNLGFSFSTSLATFNVIVINIALKA